MTLRFVDSQETLEPRNIICLGRNYAKHAEELGNPIPVEPVIFLKPTSSIIHDGDTIIIPKQSKNIHHEIELAVIIGEGGSKIPKEEAYDHVLGYAVLLDITARDIQARLKENRIPWAYAKGFDTFCPISDITLKDKITDPQNLDLKLTVSGELRQNSNTKWMLNRIDFLIEYISAFMTLGKGDIIATGTPEGVGPLIDGDETIAEIQGLSTLKNKVATQQ